MHLDAGPARRHYVTIFLVSLSLLALEIAVARVLAVALWSHFAFVAISLAMFGLGLSGLAVYLFPGYFDRSALDRQLVSFSAAFGVCATLSVLAFLRIEVVQELSLAGFWTLSLGYIVLALPFFLGGVCISLLMAHFSAQIGRIYFADLAGASLGCLGVVLAMQRLPAPQVTLLVACLAAAGSLLLGTTLRPRRLLAPLLSCAALAVLVSFGFASDLYRMRYVKVPDRPYSEYEAWNSFSRVSAFHVDRNAAQYTPLPKLPTAYAGDEFPKTMMLDVDGAAFTPMMNFDGDPASIQFLRESALFAVHHLRPRADVLIIGVGGGRDLLAAVAFNQRSILGIELNPLMRHMVEERFGEYSGHAYTLPGVEVIIDEARSRLHRIDRKFDVIQLSLIDTLSLNAAGGLVFSENNLYTVEAYREFFRHLKPDGILVLSRYFVPVYTMELLRMGVIAREAWKAEGEDSFADSLVVLHQRTNGTALVKKSPYSQAELSALEELSRENRIRIVYRPGGDNHPDFEEMATSGDLDRYVANHEYRIYAPTDDRPFFWNFLWERRTELPSRRESPFEFEKMWNESLGLMRLLVLVVITLAVVFFLGPLLLLGRRQVGSVRPAYAGGFLLYFACLGYGFMLVEIPLMQRFILFLGQPIYSLAVVLFGLLLYSGIGSLWSGRWAGTPRRALVRVLLAILGVSLLYAYGVSPLIDALLGLELRWKLAITVLVLAPIGLLLGMAYPLGIAMLREHSEDMVPWAWGMNGALSVVGSVFAAFLGSRVGFTGAWLTGVAAYGVALVCIVALARIYTGAARSRA